MLLPTAPMAPMMQLTPPSQQQQDAQQLLQIVLQLQGQEKQLQQKRQKVLQGTLRLQQMKQVEWCSLQVSFGTGAWKFGVYKL